MIAMIAWVLRFGFFGIGNTGNGIVLSYFHAVPSGENHEQPGQCVAKTEHLLGRHPTVGYYAYERRHKRDTSPCTV